jgi:hypothetical protein
MYFDPGTGSMLIQILIGAIPVIGAFFIGLRKKIFRKKEDITPVDDQTTTETHNTAVEKTDDGFEDIDDD